MNSNKTIGKLVLNNGHCVYEGEILDGKATGKGFLRWDDGENWEGTFINGVPNGQCKRFWDDGMYVEGVFENAQPVGDVKLYQPNVGLFEGPLNGRGKCKMTYPDGSYYIGECVDQQPDGWGTKVQPGLEREGEWRNGEPHGYSINKVSDARAAQVGAQTGWTGEGVITQGVQRQWWIRTSPDKNDGKPEILRASDKNFNIPQSDLPLSIKARLFLGFIDMYKQKTSGLESQINELVAEDQILVAKINSQSSYANQLQAVVSAYDNEILNAEDGSDEEDMASFYGNLSEHNLTSSVKDLNVLRSRHEQIVSLNNTLNRKYDLLEIFLSQPIEKKAEAYYNWLLEEVQTAESVEEYAELVKKFSNISEFKNCAELAAFIHKQLGNN
jgi:hypothetical protein